MKLKVCGLKFGNNIKDMVKIKPYFMGFIFYPPSKRFVGADFVMPEIPESIRKVGVFVNENKEKIIETINKYKLDIVQLHGNENPELCKEINEMVPVIKAFGLNEDFDFSICKEFEQSCSYFLFDTKTENFGGSGKKFNWEILNKYEFKTPFFLSGGISMNDLGKVKNIKHESLYAIDINSGFETEPGFKNVQLIKQFKDAVSS